MPKPKATPANATVGSRLSEPRTQPLEPIMPKPRAPESDTEQYRRFVEMARELGCDETGAPFERALDVILSPLPGRETAARQAERPAPKGHEAPVSAGRRRGRPRKSL